MDMDRLQQEFAESISTNEFHELVRRYIVFEQDKKILARECKELGDNIKQIDSWQDALREKVKPFRNPDNTVRVRTVVFNKTIGVVTWHDSGRGWVSIEKTTLEREPKK